MLNMLGLRLGAGYMGVYSPTKSHPNSSFIDNIHFFVWTLYFNNNQKRWLLLTRQNESFVLGFLLVATSVGAKQTILPTSILSCYS